MLLKRAQIDAQLFALGRVISGPAALEVGKVRVQRNFNQAENMLQFSFNNPAELLM